MRLVVSTLTDEGDGTTFNRKTVMENKTHNWGGRWNDFFLKQRHPRTWLVRRQWARLFRRLA